MKRTLFMAFLEAEEARHLHRMERSRRWMRGRRSCQRSAFPRCRARPIGMDDVKVSEWRWLFVDRARHSPNHVMAMVMQKRDQASHFGRSPVIHR